MIQKNMDKIIMSAALAIAASALLPIAKSTFRPLVANGLEGGLGIVNRARSFIQIAREEVEDIIAEAQFERIRRQLDKEIASVEAGLREN
jgi:hypothetical protein